MFTFEHNFFLGNFQQGRRSKWRAYCKKSQWWFLRLTILSMQDFYSTSDIQSLKTKTVLALPEYTVWMFTHRVKGTKKAFHSINTFLRYISGTGFSELQRQVLLELNGCQYSKAEIYTFWSCWKPVNKLSGQIKLYR